MNYYYDIILNFQEDSCLFYEWMDTDSFDFIKKIPVFYVSSKNIKDFSDSEIRVDEEFLKLIYNKTKLKDGTLEYVALFVSKNGAIALEFNQNGVVISRSYLQVNDECNLMEISYTFPKMKIDYKVIKKLETRKELRIEKDIKRFINLEITTLYNNKEWEKIVFLYNEWFLKNNNNVAAMVQEMQNKLKGKIAEKEYKIYNLIKLSYNNV